MSPNSAIEQRIISAQSDGRLSLCDQRLIAVPESIWTLSSSKTELGWWQKSPLISIDLSQNDLVDVDIPDLEELQLVNLALNRLQSIIVRAPALITLNLSNNRLKALPDLPASLTSLNVMNNELYSMGELPNNLKVLQAAHNRLGKAPKLPASLEVLDLSDNRIDSISIDYLSNLRQLNLSSNQLTEFTGPPSLRSVELSRNRMQAFPNLGVAVIDLNISCNRISDVGGIVDLFELNRVDLSENLIRQIPIGIVRLSKLAILNLRSNDLNDIPSELGHMQALTHIYLNGNPLRRIRPNNWQKGTETLKQYLSDRMAPVEDFAGQKLKPIC